MSRFRVLSSLSRGLAFATALTFSLFVSSSGVASDVSPSGLSDEQLAAGWISLFDGKSLYGWRAAAKADWKAEDGAIRVTSGEKGLLHTTTQFGDYELRLEFRAAAETNSGVFLRTSPKPKSAGEGCYELNIAPPSNPFPTGSLAARQRARIEGAVAADQWHAYEVRVEGGRIQVKLDGSDVLDYRDPRPLGRGYIGLQHNSGAVSFRHIRLLPLGLKSLFNGRDLSGWKTVLTRQSKFAVNARGELSVADGPGQIESQAKFADLVMQLECKCNGDELNSGVFFRSIPDDFQNGYECQIHNGMKDGDPTKPSNGGTGGIFRLQEARRIVAADHQWFTMTIVADGPHMAAWVNGIQVSDWTDRREPHENPRRGRRLAAGTLILQGHDPTTDLLFRNLRAGEIPPRR